jgi:hypothetical protein
LVSISWIKIFFYNNLFSNIIDQHSFVRFRGRVSHLNRTAQNIMNTVFLVVKPCSFERTLRFVGTYRLRLQGRGLSQARNHQAKIPGCFRNK